MISFACPACERKLRVQEELAGKRGKCPHCKAAVVVPGVAVAAGSREDAPTLAPSSPSGSAFGKSSGSASHISLSGSDTFSAGLRSGTDRSLVDFLAPRQAADEIGRLGTYRILKVLGHGGMGVVYQAEDPHLRRLVAIKAMLPTLAASATARERFLREARAAAAIEHDNIVPIFQVGEDRGVPFIAMPFLKGESLEDRLQREGALPVVDVLRIGKESAEGLAAAHARGMIHRDIKPANLWLETRGESGVSRPGFRVKILDFGLVRSAGAESNLTQQGAIMGTPSYLAPEQAGGEVDARADLFSLGVVLYRMISGQLPFKGKDSVATLIAVAMEQPPAPVELTATCPAELSDLVMELLDKNPAGRPKSAQALLARLQRIETDPTSPIIQVPMVSALKKATSDRPAAKKKRKKAARLPPWAWAVVGAGASAILLLGFLGLKALTSKPAPDPVKTTVLAPSQPKDTTVGEVKPTNKPAPAPEAVKPPDKPAPAPEAVKPANPLPPHRRAGQQKENPATIRASVPSPDEAKLNRQMAEKLIDLKLSLRAAVPGKVYEINNIQKKESLPAEPFWITSVSGNGEGINDATLKVFDGVTLRGLYGLEIRRSGVRGSGLAFLRGMVNLMHLSIFDCQLDDDALREVRAFPRLDQLHLAGSRVTDAGLEALTGLDNLQALNLQNTQVTDAGLKVLAQLPNLQIVYLPQQTTDKGLAGLRGTISLRQLDLRSTQVAGLGLAVLRDLPNLAHLTLSGTPITDAGLENIKGFQQLRDLLLDGTDISDKGLEHLKTLNLLTLNLSGTQITGSGLQHLQAENLSYLYLGNTPTTDAVFGPLKRFTKLSNLDLSKTKVTGQGVGQLKDLERLSNLQLGSTSITDDDVPHLAKLKNLKFLGLGQTRLTADGAKRLKEALPMCDINQ